MSKMMGAQQRTESLFYYFRLEDQIPNDHLLRLLDQHIDFSFVRERLRKFYSSTGRPSIDPEVLLRLLLICTGSPANAVYSRKYACIWRIAGSLDWVSNGRFPTTRHSPKTATAAFGSRICFAKFLRRSCSVVWKLAWSRVGPWR